MLRNDQNLWQDDSGVGMARRWLMLLAASVLLHVMLLRWIDGGFDMPALRSLSETIISATLRDAEAAPVLSRDAPNIPAPVKKPKRRPSMTAKNLPSPPLDTNAVHAAQVATTPAQDSAPAPDAAPNVEDRPNETASAQEPAMPPYKVSLPPSVDLKYDVEKIRRNGDVLSGHGNINWHTTGNDYVINGDAGILFITALTFKSEGAIDDSGVAPVIYSEKRFRKSETNTHFHRERNTISFSASETSYPRKGGEQDRASVIWQLAGIGRADGEQFAPDAEFSLFVAGARDGETWRLRVIGEDDVETGAGRMSAWHIVREPRHGSYDQRLDIWLAPKYEWYPVKLRYTEANGDYLDMLLSDMSTPAKRK